MCGRPRSSPGPETAEARASAVADFRASYSAGIRDLCSNHWNLPFTPVELQRLAVPGDREDGSNPAPTYRAQGLPKRLSAKEIEEIVRRYEAGESARSLAVENSVAASALIRLLRENNVVVRRREVADDEAHAMAHDYETGATMADLEDKYRLSHGAVYRALHRVGVKTRPSAPRPH